MAATLEAVPSTKTVDNQTETTEADAARELVRMAKERGAVPDRS
jgi:putative transposase